MATHLYFVRHGESLSNKDQRYYGPEAELTEEGRKQAAAVGERFTRIPIDGIVVSSFARAKETAAAIGRATGLPLETNDLLVECRRPSIQQGRSHHDEEMRALVTHLLERYHVPGYRYSDEENFDDIKERALQAVAFLEAHPAERLCVVTHGIFMRALFCAFMFGDEFTGRDFRHAYSALSTGNTGVSYVHMTGYGWNIASWNDLAHLG